MKTSDFAYSLPPERIAQQPAEPRDSSRLMVLDRRNESIRHDIFRNLGDYFRPGDCLILNDTKVLPARLYGARPGKDERVEFLLLREREAGLWECLAGPGRKAKEGASFSFGEGRMFGDVQEVLPGGNRLVRFVHEGSFFAALEDVGEMPLPHYITEAPKDASRYQTVYAKTSGSAAAPTAGLHFTKGLLASLEARGIAVGYVTLHVGLGTFRPVKAARVEEHTMHSEHYTIPAATAELIRRTKEQGGRVVSVGTTCCRTLETAAREHGQVVPCEGWTNIFIYPGFTFRCADALLTNFHLPESTLIMLVSAFYGREKTLAAYETAAREGYRFYSFGDVMLIE
ncbi:MAG: tRNA preQ1(34) S-adenosylmethionine ribosyltransferase-isomerase QueA [Oscillospiraceae bacterium]|jgi:S-adenosylmethionine:tRNA ribosyltransferase-isomerase|nr:tRNA preQ1(34) S-adenosylmethionine ribosyltransferase-isomerase QueA [Oscillospiraceae bacterium]